MYKVLRSSLGDLINLVLLLVGVLALSRPYAAYGQTWTQTEAPLTNWASVACSADGSTAIAAFSHGVYISTNSGATWTPTAVTGASDVALSADGRTLVAVGAFGNWISTNSGTTWVGPQFEGFNLFSSVACSGNGSKIVAGVPPGMHGGGAVYISGDFGVTWVLSVGPTGPNYCAAVACSADGNKLVVAGNDGFGRPLWTSSDAGSNWTMHDLGTWQAVACSADGSKAYAATYSWCYRSTDSGDSWELLTQGSGFSVSCSADGTHVLRSGAQGVYTSTDLGNTWRSNDVPALSLFSVASSADGCRLFAAAVGGGGICTSRTTPAPTLNVAESGPNFLLSWIVPSMNFVLQESPELTTWSDVDVNPTLNYTDLQYEVSLPRAVGSRFYRLVLR